MRANIIEVMKFYLKSTTKNRDAAAVVLSKFFTRSDIQKTDLLKQYVLWGADTIQNLKTDPVQQFFVTGIYSSLVEIFKSTLNFLTPKLAQEPTSSQLSPP